MSILAKAALLADRTGLRRPLAKLATRAYRHRTFSVDSSGFWVNAERGATFVSPTVHTASLASIFRIVSDYWCWGYTPRDGDTVIDVGAGIGEEAVAFSRLVGPAGRVIAIEAHPTTFACLQRTIRRSRATNVTAINCAVMDKAGEAAISTGAEISSTVIDGKGEIPVPARSLDDICANLGNIALLKMNIEGAERLAVQGMGESASRIQNAVIACHDFIAEDCGLSDNYRTRDEVRRTLEALGYAVRTKHGETIPHFRDNLYGSR